MTDKALHLLKLAVPHALTASRIAFGAAAITSIPQGKYYLAAMLITFGAVTDVFDGLLARRLGTASAFGALFDTFTDYLCFVVAPWALTRSLLRAEGDLWIELLIGLPLLTGAIRYARNSLIIAKQDGEMRELPGLATVFFAFLPVAAIFTDAFSIVGEIRMQVILMSLVVLFSLLMVTSVRYPKLPNFRALTAMITVALIAMPFIGTRPLALIMVAAGLLYIVFAPLLIRAKALPSYTGPV
jgi:CDP-diacylglycerol--serine O-phosphatidyltransferase